MKLVFSSYSSKLQKKEAFMVWLFLFFSFTALLNTSARGVYTVLFLNNNSTDNIFLFQSLNVIIIENKNIIYVFMNNS